MFITGPTHILHTIGEVQSRFRGGLCGATWEIRASTLPETVKADYLACVNSTCKGEDIKKKPFWKGRGSGLKCLSTQSTTERTLQYA